MFRKLTEPFVTLDRNVNQLAKANKIEKISKQDLTQDEETITRLKVNAKNL